ncbi:MAG: BMP family protein [Clostridiales Family XIII bacterium]|jgi:basic membrane protein A|nr:BMP family protein [Clostridiales Family XIII bacterium]
MKKQHLFLSVLLATVLTLSLALSACGGTDNDSEAAAGSDAEKSEKIKVALVLPGSISDASWNAGAYNGLTYIEENRDDVETAYVEEISNEKAEATLVNYAEEGYDLILAFGSEYTESIKNVAAQYPDVYFANTDQGENLGLPENATTFAADESAASYIVGVLAGYLSKSGTVGTVEGFESPDLSSNTVNYFAGFKSIKPDGNTLNSYVGSWSDVEKAKQTALAQIEQGADFIYASGDAIGLGIIDASKEKTIYVAGYGTDLNSLAPENIVTSVIWNTGITYNHIIDDIKAGSFKNTIYREGLQEGAVTLADYHGTVPDDIAAKVEEIKEKIFNGEIKLG